MRASILRLTSIAMCSALAASPAIAVCGTSPDKPCVAPDPALMALGAALPAAQPPARLATPVENDPPPALPFSVQTNGGALSLRSGLGDLSGYEARELARKVESVKPALPPGSNLPKPAAVKRLPVDVWTGVEANGLDSTGPAGEANANLKTSLGADYRFAPASAAGVAIERQEPAEVHARSPLKQDDKLSAYLSLGAMPGLTIETKAQWERSGTGSAGESDAAGNDKMSVSIAPRVGKTFAAGAGATVEPYVTVKREVDGTARTATGPGAGPAGTLSSKDSAGAGVTFAKPDAYSLGLSTSLDGIGATEPASVAGKLQLKLPLH